MRIYLTALILAIGIVAAACADSAGPAGLTPSPQGGGETAEGTVGAGAGQARPVVDRCQQPEFDVFEERSFQELSSRLGKPLQPLIFCGRVIVNGELAPDGTLVAAISEGQTCASTETRDGRYRLHLPLFHCPKERTAELAFLVDGQPARTLRSFGPTQYVDLIVTGAP